MKNKILCTLMVVVVILCGIFSTKQVDAARVPYLIKNGSGNNIVDSAMSHLGKSYIWGANGPDNFDCSGLVTYVYKSTGTYNFTSAIGGRPTTATYTDYFKDLGLESHKNTTENCKAGDIVIFYDSSGTAGHMGIYIGNGKMIHAPQTGDVVKISPIKKSVGRKYKSYVVYRIFGELGGFAIKATKGNEVANEVTFDVTTPNGNIETYTSDSNGMIYLNDRAPGTYTIHPTSTIKGYLAIQNDIVVELNADMTTNINIYNYDFSKITEETITNKKKDLYLKIMDFPIQ